MSSRSVQYVLYIHMPLARLRSLFCPTPEDKGDASKASKRAWLSWRRTGTKRKTHRASGEERGAPCQPHQLLQRGGEARGMARSVDGPGRIPNAHGDGTAARENRSDKPAERQTRQRTDEHGAAVQRIRRFQRYMALVECAELPEPSAAIFGVVATRQSASRMGLHGSGEHHGFLQLSTLRSARRNCTLSTLVHGGTTYRHRRECGRDRCDALAKPNSDMVWRSEGATVQTLRHRLPWNRTTRLSNTEASSRTTFYCMSSGIPVPIRPIQVLSGRTRYTRLHNHMAFPKQDHGTAGTLYIRSQGARLYCMSLTRYWQPGDSAALFI
ncbi:uncharacterized protein EV422DRAFT_194215 [Fimicolochytrium jonesii]|uniref:uncharacterized protein n=1 Tax=Fimicolochytrium jonesii TaxID=1396493 RepID=UPI0022FE8FF0|nr:uncharacterized protein EV422DRAFT_194215 [Fimicolochytrium jonesii]KAI8818202.1 hypothetical protein EV422DRAFT_194215 [Fimicolochytrium jonesii]